MGEADKVADLGNDHHGGYDLEAAEGHEGIDDGFVGPGLAEEHHVGVEPLDAFEELLDLQESLFENDAVGGKLELEVSQEAPVHARPVGLARVVDAEAAEQGEHAGAGAPEVVMGIDTSTAEIADGLVGLIRNTYGGQLSGAVETGELAGVLFIGFDLVAGLGRDQRGGNHGAGHADPVEMPGDPHASPPAS